MKEFTHHYRIYNNSFRAARSENNTEPAIIDSDTERAVGLHNAPKLSSDDEL